MSLTDSEILEEYKLARDTLVGAIQTNESVVEIEIRGKRSRVTDPQEMLETVESMIRYYENRVSASTYGRARNNVRLRKTK